MSLPSWCYVGAKVVCVDATLTPGHILTADAMPVEGAVYIVTGLGTVFGEQPCITISGCPNKTFGEPPDDGWRLSRFRPLVSQADDIEAHFSKLLIVSTPQTVEA